MSIRVAIDGNIIDFGVKNAHIDIEKEVEQILKRINLSFFLLRAKRPVIAKDLECKAGDIVLKGQIPDKT